MKKILKLVKNTDGQSLVEFALVLPILGLLILGMIEFGWILNGQITLTNAAREGARAAVVCTSETAAETAATTAVEKYKNVSGLSTIEIRTGDFDFNKTTGITTVKVTGTIKPIVGLFYTDDVSLVVTIQMRIE